MAKRDIYDVRFVTGDGSNGYFSQLSLFDEVIFG